MQGMQRGVVVAVILAGCTALGWNGATRGQEKSDEVSFKKDVFPVINKYCMPCHEEENYNKSELSLDNYSLLVKGGKNGVPVVEGKPDESILIQKLSEKPPFGDTMPRGRRGQGPPKKLTPEELKVLTTWIEQGAKDN